MSLIKWTTSCPYCGRECEITDGRLDNHLPDGRLVGNICIGSGTVVR